MTNLDTRSRILTSARDCLVEQGYAAVSTRKVADGAGVPLSQIHYHFGSKEQLILAMLRAENDRLLDRQATMFSGGGSFAEQWGLACDYLEDDLESGYVRVLQEMIAAGWSSEIVGAEVRDMLKAWEELMTGVISKSEQEGASLGPFSASDLATLNAAIFLGAESMILLGKDVEQTKQALRGLGAVLAMAQEGFTQ